MLEYGAFFYDQLDDTVGIARSQEGELIKVRFDGTAIVEASRSPFDGLDAIGRQRDGLLVARDKQGGLIVRTETRSCRCRSTSGTTSSAS
jgi:hypothetical protein